jgi:exodeoxyribonuclease VII small subunit
MPKQIATDYQTLNRQLEDTLARLQQSDIEVDEAVKLYEQGLKLVAELEAHLATAENKIEQLKLKAGSNG